MRVKIPPKGAMEDIDLLIEGEPGDRFGWAHRPILGRAWHGVPVLGMPLPEQPLPPVTGGARSAALQNRQFLLGFDTGFPTPQEAVVLTRICR
jgi:hypothetical protein